MKFNNINDAFLAQQQQYNQKNLSISSSQLVQRFQKGDMESKPAVDEALMAQAIEYIEQGNAYALSGLFASVYPPNFYKTFHDGDALWEAVLKQRLNDTCCGFAVLPNYDMMCLLAVYSVPFGTYKMPALRAFQPGFFGINNPKNALLDRIVASLSNPVEKLYIDAGMESNSPLLQILRYEGKNKHLNNSGWEEAVRALLVGVRQRTESSISNKV